MSELTVKIVSTPEQVDKVYSDIFKFCGKAVKQIKQQSEEEDIDYSQTIINMSYIDWESNNECLMYRIYVACKFDGINGILVMLYDGDNLIALSGVEMWNRHTVSLGKRAYTLREYRERLINTKYLMPAQIEWANRVHPNAKLFIVTVNEYLKDHSFSALKHWIESKIDFWVDWKVYDGTYNFFNIPQYFVYNLIDNKENIIDILDDSLGD